MIQNHEIEESLKSQELKDLLTVLPPLNITKGPWIAGGAARRILENLPLDEGDIDLFFSSWEQFYRFQKSIQVLATEKPHETNYAITYPIEVSGKNYRIQLIKRKSYSSTGFLFDDFDFTVCQIATDGVVLAWEEGAFLDIQNKVLRLAPGGRTTDSNMVRRTIKYIKYGYIPEKGLMNRVVEIGLRGAFIVGLEAMNSYDWDGVDGLTEDPIDKITL